MTSRDHDDGLPMSRTPPVDEDVRREIEFHIEQRAAELIRSGMSRERALAAARESFGDRDQVEAECRVIERRRRTASRRADRVAALRQDVIVGWRMLRKTPGFAVAAIVTLALGIGANSAVFSIVNRVLLQPLPYEDADRLVTIVEQHENGSGNVPWSNFLDLRERSRSFNGMASYGAGVGTVLTGVNAIRVRAGSHSVGLFQVLRVVPFKGRFAAAEEHRIGADPVTVVSYAFWRDYLGAPESLDGVRVRYSLDYAVIGVLPPGFEFDSHTQLWRPMEVQEQSVSRTSHNWSVVGRLRDGVTPPEAERELGEILARLRPVHVPDFDAVGAIVTPLQEVLTGTMRTPLYMLLAASGILLLAACTNIASAQLARGTGRVGEFALRSALGASRGRLIRQLLAESALLAFVGAAAGLVLAFAMLRVLTSIAPATLGLERVVIDGWVQGFTAVVAVVTTVLVGLVPALRLSDANTNLALREGGRGTAGAQRLRAWNVLVAAEVALAVTLLAGSTLLIKSFARVMDQDLGFDPAGAIAMTVDLPAVNYASDSPRIAAFHDELVQRLESTRGVEDVGFVNTLPLEGNFPNGAMVVEGKPPIPGGRGQTGSAIYRVTGGNYFDALGIRVVRGEVFSSRRRLPPYSLVVNQAFVDQEWPNENPIGKRVMVAGMDGATEPWYTVAGVVASVRGQSVVDRFRATYFFDHHDRPPYRTRSVRYVVRYAGDFDAVATALRGTVTDLDAEVAVEMRRMTSFVSTAVTDRRFTMIVLGTFAGVALMLAVAGIYAVVSYAVSQRRQEIGIRLALGATPRAVRSLVMKSAAMAIVPGLLAGTALALLTARAITSLLFNVSPFDPGAFTIAVVGLGAAAFVSSAVPSFRATRVDPLQALRGE